MLFFVANYDKIINGQDRIRNDPFLYILLWTLTTSRVCYQTFEWTNNYINRFIIASSTIDNKTVIYIVHYINIVR